MARTTVEAVVRTAQNLAASSPRSDVAAMFDLVVRLGNFLATRCLTAAGLVIGSVAPEKVKIANTITFVINGKFYSKTTAEIAIPATMTMADNGATRQVYGVLTVDVNGTVTITPGTIALSAVLPSSDSLPADQAMIGHVKISAAAGTAFTATSTSLAAAGITTTYTDAQWIDRDFPDFTALQ